MPPAASLYVSKIGTAPANWFGTAEASLTEAERRRIPKRANDEAWRRHILSRRLMRFALADWFGSATPEIEYPDDGPPRPISAATIGVSLSHCQETVVVVLSEQTPIGCDILTSARKTHWQRIAKSFFSKAECDWLMEATATLSKKRFDYLWCTKEALVKFAGKPLLECLGHDVRPGQSTLAFWSASGTVAGCTYAVVCSEPLVMKLIEVPADTL